MNGFGIKETPNANQQGLFQKAIRPAGSSKWSMHSRLRLTLAVAVLGFFSSTASLLQAQARPAGVRKADLQIGGGYTFAQSDYDPKNRFYGPAIYVTYDFKPHFGVEATFHQINSSVDKDKTYERTYEVGGRYVRHYGRFNPYAKVMYGRGVFNYPNPYDHSLPAIANLAYNLIGFGGGVDINVQKHINVRVEYEMQRWFSFEPNVASDRKSSLMPQLVTIGAAYHF